MEEDSDMEDDNFDLNLNLLYSIDDTWMRMLNIPSSMKESTTPTVTEALNTPSSTNELKAPNVTEELNTPSLTNELKAPNVTEELNTPSLTNELKAPNVTEELNTPSVTKEMNMPSVLEMLNVPSTKKKLNVPSIGEEFKVPCVMGNSNVPNLMKDFLLYNNKEPLIKNDTSDEDCYMPACSLYDIEGRSKQQDSVKETNTRLFKDIDELFNKVKPTPQNECEQNIGDQLSVGQDQPDSFKKYQERSDNSPTMEDADSNKNEYDPNLNFLSTTGDSWYDELTVRSSIEDFVEYEQNPSTINADAEVAAYMEKVALFESDTPVRDQSEVLLNDDMLFNIDKPRLKAKRNRNSQDKSNNLSDDFTLDLIKMDDNSDESETWLQKFDYLNSIEESLRDMDFPMLSEDSSGNNSGVSKSQILEQVNERKRKLVVLGLESLSLDDSEDKQRVKVFLNNDHKPIFKPFHRRIYNSAAAGYPLNCVTVNSDTSRDLQLPSTSSMKVENTEENTVEYSTDEGLTKRHCGQTDSNASLMVDSFLNFGDPKDEDQIPKFLRPSKLNFTREFITY